MISKKVERMAGAGFLGAGLLALGTCSAAKYSETTPMNQAATEALEAEFGSRAMMIVSDLGMEPSDFWGDDRLESQIIGDSLFRQIAAEPNPDGSVLEGAFTANCKNYTNDCDLKTPFKVNGYEMNPIYVPHILQMIEEKKEPVTVEEVLRNPVNQGQSGG